MVLDDLLDDRPLLRLLVRVEPVGFVLADDGQVGVDGDDLQGVELAEVVADRKRRARHPADGLVAVDELLDGHLVEDLPALGRLELLLRLDGGLEPVGPTLEFGDAAAGGGDELDPPIDDEIVDVALDQGLRVEGEVDGGEVGGAVAEELDAELVLDPGDAGIGEGDGAAVGADLVVGARDEGLDEGGDALITVLDGRGPGEDERHAGFVDEHGVGLVDDDDIAFGDPDVLVVEDEAVAEDVEADLGDGGVEDLRPVGFAPVVVVEGGRDRGRGDAEEIEDRLHPRPVADGEVVVDADDVDPAALERISGRGERTDERLALTGGHLDDVPLEESDESDELRVVGAFAQGALGGLPREGRITDEGLAGGAGGEHLTGGVGQLGIAEIGEFGGCRIEVGGRLLEPSCGLVGLGTGPVEQTGEESQVIVLLIGLVASRF